jgi:hypothetical protein
LIAAVDLELQHAGRPHPADFGPARFLRRTKGLGIFQVALHGRRVNLDSLRDLELVSADDGRLTFPVREVAIEGGALIVRAAAPDDLELRLSAVNDTAFMLRALRERLTALTDPGLATPLMMGALPPLQLAGTERQGAKEHARQAICAPGMNVIWGPPGTGKTTVTAAAIAELVRERHSVLLVSTPTWRSTTPYSEPPMRSNPLPDNCSGSAAPTSPRSPTIDASAWTGFWKTTIATQRHAATVSTGGWMSWRTRPLATVDDARRSSRTYEASIVEASRRLSNGSRPRNR